MSFSLSLSACVQPQEAEFCIFRGRNNSLISLVFMLVSHFSLPNRSCSPPTRRIANTYAIVIEIGRVKGARRTVNTGFKINLAPPPGERARELPATENGLAGRRRGKKHARM